MRLVKGAYWDTEIKRGQEQGLKDYPVFTRKLTTDTSYLACARAMLAAQDALYPQFATHNAHTVAAIDVIATGKEFEFQRLHGMGEALHEFYRDTRKGGATTRIYAPVGSHEGSARLSRAPPARERRQHVVRQTVSPTATRRSTTSSPIQ